MRPRPPVRVVGVVFPFPITSDGRDGERGEGGGLKSCGKSRKVTVTRDGYTKRRDGQQGSKER